MTRRSVTKMKKIDAFNFTSNYDFQDLFKVFVIISESEIRSLCAVMNNKNLQRNLSLNLIKCSLSFVCIDDLH